MAKKGKIRIYPQVFRKILEEYFGGSVEELAVHLSKKFGETVEERANLLKSLLQEERIVSIEQVEELSRKLKIAVLAFYLKDPDLIPKRTTKRDNRFGSCELSYKDRIWLRNAEILHEILEEIIDFRPDIESITKNLILEDESRLSEGLRKILEFDLEIQKKLDDAALFQLLRSRIEDRGIPVVRLPLDAKNIRGSVIHGKIPLIIVSSYDYLRAQSFTLIHELCHIIQRSEMEVMELCRDYYEISRDNHESFCNRVAGKFLLPNKVVEKEYRENEFDDLEQFVKFLSNKYRVSREVVYNRMIESRLIDRSLYEKYRQNVEGDWKSYIRGRPDYATVIVNRYGRLVISELLDAYHRRRISESELIYALNLGDVKKVEQIELALYSGV